MVRSDADIYASRPGLAKAVADWFLGEYLKFQRDSRTVENLVLELVPTRVGIQINPDGIGCYFTPDPDDPLYVFWFPVSWAEHLLMREKTGVRAGLPVEEHFLTLAVTCLVRTADGKYLLAKRSQEVSTHQGLWNTTCAGYVDRFRLEEDGLISAAYAELKQEANLMKEHLTGEPQLLGLCQHPIAPKLPIWVEASFFAETTLTAEQALELAKSAKDRFEGKHSAFTEDEVHALMEVGGRMHPPAAANIALALNRV